ncbi:MAG: WXG100 family type VII secretion target [Clostridiales Family XIII bacterium]|jgi:WXG100 family type VII secretion target|nr:WXG100 family type VII secretion target [Clostridiales Family XIII bacterium]
MAAGVIRLTPQELRDQARAFDKEGQNLDTSIKAMDGYIRTLETQWEGEAARKFSEQFNSLKPSFEKMQQLIIDISGQLNGSAEAYESLDREIAGKFSV